MARVLESLGGVAPGDLVFVADGSRRALKDGFATIQQMLRAEQTRGVRRELVFYYSGHSDEEGLLLGSERISYQELRAFIHEAPADLSLAILDSCESGAFTRHKGGARRAPFLLDASIDTHGHAFLTSSAANEVAQESDRIAASFFTYYLVSGLRGAADANRDRRVTLQEAFQFASQETLARTERTQGGPQHAAYEFDLTGTGDMVVTDVRTTQAGLVLTPELSGRISVREAGGALVAELRKPAGSSVELGLEAGSYVVAVENDSAVKEAQLTLAAGKHLALGGAAFHPGAPWRWPSRAAATTPRPRRRRRRRPSRPRRRAAARDHRLQGRLHPPLHRRPDRRRRLLFRVHRRPRRQLRGVQLSLGYNQIDGAFRGLQLRPAVNVAGSLTSGRADRRRRQHGRRRRSRRADRRRRQRRRRRFPRLADRGGRQRHDRTISRPAVGRRPQPGRRGLGPAARGRRQRGAHLPRLADRRRQRRRAPPTAFAWASSTSRARPTASSWASSTSPRTTTASRSRVLNLIGNGIHGLSVYGTDALLSNVALQLGGRHLLHVVLVLVPAG